MLKKSTFVKNIDFVFRELVCTNYSIRFFGCKEINEVIQSFFAYKTTGFEERQSTIAANAA